ncbi:MAG: hypothetical protein ACE5OZ_26135 [Candidatus Heimdallarchaeota archaeon]
METVRPKQSSPSLLNLWVFTSEGLLITHFSNEESEDVPADSDIIAGLLLALTDLAGQLRGSTIQGIILEDRQLYYKQVGDLFAVGETSLDFSMTKELLDSLLFILNRFAQTQRDMPGFLKLDDFASTKSEIQSYLVFNGLLEKREVFEHFAKEEIVDNIGAVTSQYLSQDGTLITGSTDRFLKIWSLSKKKKGVFFKEGHTSTIKAVISLKQHIMSFSEAGEVFLWDKTNWEPFDNFSIDCAVQSAFVDPHHDDRLLLLEESRIALLLLDSQTLIPAEYQEEPSRLIHSCFIFEGEQIISIYANGSVCFHDATSLKIKDLSSIRLDPEDQICSASFFPQDRAIVVTTKNGFIIEYDPNRKTSDKLPIYLYSGEVSFLTNNPKLDALIIGFHDGSISLILPFSKREKAFQIHYKGHSDPVAFIGYLLRQDTCVTCSTSRDIRIWHDVQFKDAIKILQGGKDKLENVYRNLNEMKVWAEEVKPVETERAARKMLMRGRLYRSRIGSYEKVLQLSQPWWLKSSLKRELHEAITLLEEVDGLLAIFESETAPKMAHLVDEEEEEEEKISLDSIQTGYR